MTAPYDELPEDGLDADIPTSSKIVRFTGWNLFGFCAPMLVAFFSIPLFIKGLGTERFGALTLVWMLVGYFSILDLGMGRAMTKLTAEYLGTGRKQKLPGIFWTALLMMFALGMIGAFLLAGFSGWLAVSGLNIPPALQDETRRAFQVVSIGLPVTVVITGLIGVLESHQYFRMINLVRVPLGIATFAAPLAVLPFTQSLVWVVAVLIGVRIVEFVIFFSLCLGGIPALKQNVRWDTAMVKPLLTFGGWMTVSNISLPLMIHIDRFIIGAVRTITEVAYYANPAEIVVKMLILPRAWVSALFPPLTMQLARKSSEADALYGRAVKLLLLILFPAVLALFAIAPEFLNMWLGSEFSEKGSEVLRILTAGIFAYAMSYLAFALLQSAGRPDLSARWHLIELPLFLTASWWITGKWGIVGMAAIWSLRGLMDALVLFPLSLKFVPGSRSALMRCGMMMGLALLLLPVVGYFPAFGTRIAVSSVGLLLFFSLSWNWLLTGGERTWVRQQLVQLLAHKK